jgi:proline iminopeptidase
MLDAGGGQHIYWECSGNPQGHPIVYLHGGPGAGASENARSFFDPELFRIVITDQRGCGRSRPHVASIDDLAINTTQHLISDLELLRQHLQIERWSILGGSWGTTLALAYAQAHPDRVSAMILACVTTTTRREIDWITYQVGRIFPREWERFASIDGRIPANSTELLETYQRLLFAGDPATQALAAREWCNWEDAHVSLAPGFRPNARFEDPAFRLLFARLVTHYWKHAAFLEDDSLIANAAKLDGIPGVMIHGRYDVSSPAETAFRLHGNWKTSDLQIVDDSGHGGNSMTQVIVQTLSEINARIGRAP